MSADRPVRHVLPLHARILPLLAIVLHATLTWSAESPASEVKPIPHPQFEDAEIGATYGQAVTLIDEGNFKEAEKLLKAIKTKAASEEQEQAIERCLLEVDGQQELEKVDKRVEKKDWRRALAMLDKALPKYSGTHAGELMASVRETVYFELCLLVDDFEPDSKKFQPENPLPDPGAGGEGPGGGPGGGGPGGGPGGPGGGEEDIGRTGYGANTKVVEGEKAASGKSALEWLTGTRTSLITFSNVNADLTEYRWLVLKIRCEDPKKRPQLTILFDCEDGPFNTWGWGGRGGAGGVYRRMGFTSSLVPDARWDEVRVDLTKFKNTGDVTWADVRALRIVHMPGVSARVWVDDIRVEKQ